MTSEIFTKEPNILVVLAHRNQEYGSSAASPCECHQMRPLQDLQIRGKGKLFWDEGNDGLLDAEKLAL